jgi:ATP-dependent Clp protease ATP-binding subunit ClpB
MFKPLTLAEIERIVDLQLEELRERLADMRVTLVVTAEARRFIADQGFDPAYGARPLRRYISREVETRVGRALLRGEAADGGTISVDVVDGEITMTADSTPAEGQAVA